MEAVSYTLFKNSHFVAEQCRDCALPGYLIVSSVHETSDLGGLGKEAAALLGPTLVHVVSAVKEVINPLRIYCAQFGEQHNQLHFHVFPRTKEITETYLMEKPEQRELIHGPVLLDWARAKYKGLLLSQDAEEIIERIRWTLNNAA